MLSVSNSKPVRSHPAALSLASPRVSSGFPGSPRMKGNPSPLRSETSRVDVSPKGEGLDEWFADFKNFEGTLARMAMASEEPKFKEELGTIDQWFRVLSESEQTATMYSLLQALNYSQVKFLVAVQQQMVDAAIGETGSAGRQSNGRPPSLNLSGTPRSAQSTPRTTSPPSGTWANMVTTPLDVMFSQKSPEDGKETMLAKMGISNEAHLMAIQLVMSGLAQQPHGDSADTVPPLKSKKSPEPAGTRTRSPAVSSANWRASRDKYPSSALKSAKYSDGAASAAVVSPPNSSASLKSTNSTASSNIGSTPKSADDIDVDLLEDVPAWLKSLRLHKYTTCFEGMGWQKIVEFDDAELEKLGVAAQGARRRMTKTFEMVKIRMGLLPAPVASSATIPNTTFELPTVPHSAA